MHKRGFAHITLLLGLLLTVAAITYFLFFKAKTNTETSSLNKQTTCLRTPDYIHEEYNYYSNPKEFKDVDCEFPPGYPKDTLKNLDLTSCRRIDYNVIVDKNAVYKRPFDPGSMPATYYITVDNTDSKTFISLGYEYYKDKNNIYYDLGENMQTINFFDVASFDTVTSHIVKDKNGVYAMAPYKSMEYKKIEEFDPNKIIPIRNHGRDSEYYKQDNKIYQVEVSYDLNVKLLEVPEADYETFEFPYESSLAQDKDHVFFMGNIVNVADPNSFEQIGPYFRDYINVYKIVNNELVVIDGIDGCSFELISFGDSQYNWKGYSKDKNNVYYGTTVVKDADPQSFVVTEDKVYDKNYEYGGIYKKVEGEIQY
jgi:hypothetical protein